MHMSDALISPLVGGSMIILTSAATNYSINKIKYEYDDKKIPLMGVMGAFVFAAQMINFTIPGTGSSGHLGGGLLLSIFLGPYAGFITMATILLIQALLFADGGLLAYGCNVLNLGFYSAFIAYPFIYKKIISKGYSKKNIFTASILSAIVSLQLGAFSVVLQTVLSGKTELPFTTFLLLMQPIHLAIGIVEGIITAFVVSYVYKVQPEILEDKEKEHNEKLNYKKILVSFILITALTGGILSWYASSYPDGLEWSILKTTGSEELEAKGAFHQYFGKLQEKVSIMPDYNFKNAKENSDGKIGTSTSGILGSSATLGVILLIGYAIKRFKKTNNV
ncbi:energy-coupling factor ABC transporter permease [Caloramator australicus]|uniref:Substrate-specific component NikM of nickel ECF transporter / Additional substrate-specific component NikN of nickel ECF transporter n=1 Tax=Caloramator australicus RC3 TaxID=857293 RepID=I7K7U2_9CLOT|nr:energy-coupling factor ABC transporter permease [Caloramator australicus]CCJ33604.1 Substrate-specific component NikM of nickel ECF transporter / Additional substrate-specific component NikN of nickel ECF transporter [Caloramator australicus RC3]